MWPVVCAAEEALGRWHRKTPEKHHSVQIQYCRQSRRLQRTNQRIVQAEKQCDLASVREVREFLGHHIQVIKLLFKLLFATFISRLMITHAFIMLNSKFINIILSVYIKMFNHTPQNCCIDSLSMRTFTFNTFTPDHGKNQRSQIYV